MRNPTRSLLLLALLLGLALPSPAVWAQAAETTAPAQEEVGRPAYDEAFALVVAGRCGEALPLLRQLERGEDPELSARASTLAALCIAQGGDRAAAPARASAAPDTARRNAGRFPFVAWTTVAGLAAGLELDVALEVDSVTAGVGIPLITTGAAFGLSLMATRDANITQGEASLTGTGAVFGTYNALLLNAISDPGTAPSGLIALAGTSLGALGGFGLARATHMSPGDASLVGSGGLWGAITGPLVIGLLSNLYFDETTGLGLMMATTDLGLLAAGLAARVTDLSRDRVLLMDLGAMLGGLTMGGLGIILFHDVENGGVITSGMALAGLYGGGALSLYLTRNMDRRDDAPLAASLLHVDEQGVHLGRPLPTLGPDLTRPGAVAVTLPVVAGIW